VGCTLAQQACFDDSVAQQFIIKSICQLWRRLWRPRRSYSSRGECHPQALLTCGTGNLQACGVIGHLLSQYGMQRFRFSLNFCVVLLAAAVGWRHCNSPVLTRAHRGPSCLRAAQKRRLPLNHQTARSFHIYFRGHMVESTSTQVGLWLLCQGTQGACESWHRVCQGMRRWRNAGGRTASYGLVFGPSSVCKIPNIPNNLGRC
jgi:hypothetical protein